MYHYDYNSAAAPKRSWFTTPKALRLSSLIFHSALVVIHLALLGIWARGLEHQFTVALDNQKVASFLITATSTAFGTIYSAMLVFVTQALSRRQSLHMGQALTATHDNAHGGNRDSPFAPLVSKGSSCINRPDLDRSVISNDHRGTSHHHILTFLVGDIQLIPVLLGCNPWANRLSTARPPIRTTLLWVVPVSNPTFTATNALMPFKSIEMKVYAAGSLYFLPSVLDGTTSLGLQDGSLYDVLDINTVSSNATVNASGFNITCGSVPEEDRTTFEYRDGVWKNSNYTIYSSRMAIHSDQNIIPDAPSEVGIISAIAHSPYESPPDSIVLYSTIPIVDSSGKSGSWVDVSPPMSTSVSSVQLLQCSLTFVRQLATVDAQSHKIQTIGPSLQKSTSTWLSYTAPHSNVTTDGNSFIDIWANWYAVMPSSDFQLDYANDADPSAASVAEVDTQNVTLHDLENALLTLIASMFWTCHIPPTYRTPDAESFEFFMNGTIAPSLSDIPPPPILLPGNGEVMENFAEARVEV
ncbi:hypothetical protein B0H14DRAFT_3149467 [Mycena olivaceomarginata]|nr:hypothetical protein B0H14DRAFT_3149467 [Mycena olivaceomarginata]